MSGQRATKLKNIKEEKYVVKLIISQVATNIGLHYVVGLYGFSCEEDVVEPSEDFLKHLADASWTARTDSPH